MQTGPPPLGNARHARTETRVTGGCRPWRPRAKSTCRAQTCCRATIARAPPSAEAQAELLQLTQAVCIVKLLTHQPPDRVGVTRTLQLGGSLSNSELAQSPLEVRGHLVLGSALMVDERSAQLPMLAAMPRKQQPSAASGAQARGRSTARSSTRERENVDAGAMTSEEMAE